MYFFYSKNRIKIFISLKEYKNFEKYDQKKFQSEFLIYFARYAYYFQYEDLAFELFNDLVELHSGIIDASNNTDQGGARIEIVFPKV